MHHKNLYFLTFERVLQHFANISNKGRVPKLKSAKVWSSAIGGEGGRGITQNQIRIQIWGNILNLKYSLYIAYIVVMICEEIAVWSCFHTHIVLVWTTVLTGDVN